MEFYTYPEAAVPVIIHALCTVVWGLGTLIQIFGDLYHPKGLDSPARLQQAVAPYFQALASLRS